MREEGKMTVTLTVYTLTTARTALGFGRVFPYPCLRKHNVNVRTWIHSTVITKPGYQGNLSPGATRALCYTELATWLSQSQGRQEKQHKVTWK